MEGQLSTLINSEKMSQLDKNTSESIKENNNTDNSEQCEDEDTVAQAYLDHLLQDGCNEGDSKSEMKMPEWYDEVLFKR